MERVAEIRRAPHSTDSCFIPIRRPDGRVEVDSTWGHIQPLELLPGVETVGELEVIEHIEAGCPLVDTRLPHFFARATLPGAVNIPHTEILDRIDELDRTVRTVFFCNGPQCIATPEAILDLVGAGYPREAILYYRGGLHDWMTLGLPTATSRA